MKSTKPPLPGKNMITSKFSIIIPTDKHYFGLTDLISKIIKYIPNNVPTESILAHGNSDHQIKHFVSDSITKSSNASHQFEYKIIDDDKLVSIRYIQNYLGQGTISALMQEIKSSSAENIIAMNDNFSHPPQVFPKIMETLSNNVNCIAIAKSDSSGKSLIKGTLLGKATCRNTARRLFTIFGAKKRDPVKYIAFPNKVINALNSDRNGCMIPIEKLVKDSGLRVIEIHTHTQKIPEQSQR